jgi:hypothetical protein
VIIQILKDKGRSKVELFWQGDQNRVDGITDPVARYIAKQVIKEGVPQKKGKWDVSIIWEPVIELTDEEADMLPCREMSALIAVLKRTDCSYMDAKHAVLSHPNFKEDVEECPNCGDYFVHGCVDKCSGCGTELPKE